MRSQTQNEVLLKVDEKLEAQLNRIVAGSAQLVLARYYNKPSQTEPRF